MPPQTAQTAATIRLINKFVSGACKTLGFNLVSALYLKTPKDTTNASNNWIASIGYPSSIRMGSKERPTRAALIQGIRQIGHYSISMGALWVTNNVKYIVDLADGYSRQAPPGYVGDTIEVVVQGVQATYGRIKPWVNP